MKLKPLLASVATLAALNAGATAVNWGPHDPLETAMELPPPSTLHDTFSFSLEAATTLRTAAVSNNLSSILNIEGGKVSLFKSLDGGDMLMGSYSFGGTTGNTTYSISVLDPGSYYYLVEGTANGPAGGLYTLTSAPAVPDAKASTTMLMGAMGLMYLYRKRTHGR